MPTNPKLTDGDDDPPDEPEIEVILDEEKDREFYWTDDPDEIRRFYILVHMADADIDSRVLVENMDRVYKWCKSGEIEKPKPRLTKVHDKAD